MIKIVIIEDQPIILEGIKVLINQVLDFSVVAEFSNGKPFLNEIGQLAFDIVLTDIDMPVMDGIATTQQALLIHPGIKIIALSMHIDHKFYYEMITAGAKGIVFKQSSVEELEKAIRAVYLGGTYFSGDLLHGMVMNLKKPQSSSTSSDTPELNEREKELLKYICQGYSNKQLAEKLFLSVKTIESNKSGLMRKTQTKNTAGLIIWAVKNKVIEI